jgi:zinc D-Ala-D-Ala dipeptidase
MTDSGLMDLPIPKSGLSDDWQLTIIQECGESLVPLTSSDAQRILIQPQYYLRGIPGASSELFVRVGVMERLLRVASNLPSRFSLLVWDSWRPLEVQRALYEAYYRVQRRTQPDLSTEALSRLTARYVSVPSSEMSTPSPHLTGGAVDLTLADHNGVAVSMGTDFDSFDIEAHTRALEDRLESTGSWTPADRQAGQHRRILYHSMIRAGFTNFPNEWWHFDYGNQFWGSTLSKPATYGPASPNADRSDTLSLG